MNARDLALWLPSLLVAAFLAGMLWERWLANGARDIAEARRRLTGRS